MKRCIILFMLITIVILTGCSKKKGELVISNDTNQITDIKVDNTEYSLEPYETKVFSWNLSSSLFGTEEKEIKVFIYKRVLLLYDVDFTVTIKADSQIRRQVSYYFNSAGLEIQNNSTNFRIKELYYSTSATSWGSNRLTEDVLPGGYMRWNLPPGTYHLKWVDDWGTNFERRNEVFQIGYMNSYSYTGF